MRSPRELRIFGIEIAVLDVHEYRPVFEVWRQRGDPHHLVRCLGDTDSRDHDITLHHLHVSLLELVSLHCHHTRLLREILLLDHFDSCWEVHPVPEEASIYSIVMAYIQAAAYGVIAPILLPDRKVPSLDPFPDRGRSEDRAAFGEGGIRCVELQPRRLQQMPLEYGRVVLIFPVEVRSHLMLLDEKFLDRPRKAVPGIIPQDFRFTVGDRIHDDRSRFSFFDQVFITIGHVDNGTVDRAVPCGAVDHPLIFVNWMLPRCHHMLLPVGRDQTGDRPHQPSVDLLTHILRFRIRIIEYIIQDDEVEMARGHRTPDTYGFDRMLLDGPVGSIDGYMVRLLLETGEFNLEVLLDFLVLHISLDHIQKALRKGHRLGDQQYSIVLDEEGMM